MVIISGGEALPCEVPRTYMAGEEVLRWTMGWICARPMRCTAVASVASHCDPCPLLAPEASGK